jgi:CRISPR system Cascade subunit CasE
MFLSKIELSENSKLKASLWKNSSAYDYYQLIWQFFNSDEAKRPFLYRLEINSRGYYFYTLSRQFPIAISTDWKITAKNYQPILEVGDRFQFQVRVNPVICRKDESNKRGKRHDVVMDAKMQARFQNQCISQSILMHHAAQKWLQSRCSQYGFSFDPSQLIVDSYDIHRFFKKKKHKNEISISTLDLRGELIVENKELFKEALTQGIGPAKGFGCGLLMIRRAGFENG